MTTSVFSSNRTTIFWYVSIYACFDGFRQHRASTSRVSRGSLRLWVFTCTRIWDIQPLFTIFLSTTACTASAVVLHGGSCKCVLRNKYSMDWTGKEHSLSSLWVSCSSKLYFCAPISWCTASLRTCQGFWSSSSTSWHSTSHPASLVGYEHEGMSNAFS